LIVGFTDRKSVDLDNIGSTARLSMLFVESDSSKEPLIDVIDCDVRRSSILQSASGSHKSFADIAVSRSLAKCIVTVQIQAVE